MKGKVLTPWKYLTKRAQFCPQNITMSTKKYLQFKYDNFHASF